VLLAPSPFTATNRTLEIDAEAPLCGHDPSSISGANKGLHGPFIITGSRIFQTFVIEGI
jgi:hypothetical protein